jgi:hypothetical protein
MSAQRLVDVGKLLFRSVLLSPGRHALGLRPMPWD